MREIKRFTSHIYGQLYWSRLGSYENQRCSSLLFMTDLYVFQNLDFLINKSQVNKPLFLWTVITLEYATPVLPLIFLPSKFLSYFVKKKKKKFRQVVNLAPFCEFHCDLQTIVQIKSCCCYILMDYYNLVWCRAGGNVIWLNKTDSQYIPTGSRGSRIPSLM